MYTRVEKKKLISEFWTTFGKISQTINTIPSETGKWTLYKTGIKGLSLKFTAEPTINIVSIDIESNDTDYRYKLFDNLEKYRPLIEEKYGKELKWQKDKKLKDKKIISRIYVSTRKFSISNQMQWMSIYDYFIQNMLKLENIFNEYKELINVQQTENQ